MNVVELELTLASGIQEVDFPEGAMTLGVRFAMDFTLRICVVADPVRHIQVREFLVIRAGDRMPYDTLFAFIGSAYDESKDRSYYVFEVNCPEIEHNSFRQREGFNIEWLVIE